MSDSILANEIKQQPDVVSEFLELESNNVSNIVHQIKDKFNYILIAARGSSDNAARYAQYLLGAYNGYQVALATPSLFSLYEKVPNLRGALVIGISQSGQSPDIVSVLSEAKKQGCPTIAITNEAGSPLSQTSSYVIPLHTGKEKAVAATKTYTTSLASLALLSCSLANDKERMSRLSIVPEQMRQCLQKQDEIIHRAERYRYMERCAVIGRGFNYATSFEIALKIKELTRVVAEPYSSADFRHGPIATATPGFPVIIIAPQGKTYSDMLDLARILRDKGSELLVLSDQAEITKMADLPLHLPDKVDEWLSPLVAVLPGQIFAMQLAREKRLNVDQPEGLTKVTETR